MTTSRTPRTARLAVGVALSLAVSACGGSSDTGSDAAADGTVASSPAEASSTDADAAGAVPARFPMTIDSCGREVEIAAPPQDVLLLGRSGILRILLDLGLGDRVTARAGAFPAAYYTAEQQATVDAIPSLGDDLDQSGHLQISQEAILDTDPDLVVGVPDGIDREGLADAGIPVIEQPADCPEGIPDIGFDDIHDQVEQYGQLFDVPDAADALVADLEDRVAAIEQSVDSEGERTAAVLFPTVGGGTVYAYGTRSMSQQQLETAGFTNVFADTDERVFEVTGEELIARDPDVLVLLHVDGEPGPVEEAVRQLPGADGITAVREDAILTQLFSFGEYPTPLVIDGLENIVGTFG